MGDWRPNYDGLSFKGLEVSEASRLESFLSKEEVSKALTDLNGDKASGPNGFTMAFWQDNWGMLKEEVMRFFADFFQHGRFVKSLNATFFVLIPKKGGAKELKDFRPISLVSSRYKLLAKVLANRLRKVVSCSQNVFVEGRQILDTSLVANEVTDAG